MQKILLSFALIALLSASACGNRKGMPGDDTPSPTPSASASVAATVTADINPTLDTNDAVLAEVEKLQDAGTLTDVVVRESFPVQITATGPQDVITRLQKMAAGESVDSQNAGIMITTIAKKTNGMNQDAEQVLATDAESFKTLWIKHNGSEEEMPTVDFDTEVVAAVFMGQKNTGGYATEITKAELVGSELVVTYKETTPPEDGFTAQVITAPVHIARLKVKASAFTSHKFMK